MTVQPVKDMNQISNMIRILERKGNKRDPLLLRFGLNTGLRIKDILRLKVKYLFHPDGTLKEYLDLFESKTIKRKTRKLKQIKLNSVIRPELESYVKFYGLEPEDWIFFSLKNPANPLDRIRAYTMLRDAAQKSGVTKFGTHSMRKTLAYNIYNKTKDLALVMRILNHSDPEYTLRYIGIEQSNLDEAYEEFSIGA
jgi:integrase|tara:strand:+ start:68 stop:655 length:588 start_codon:yes stop_codon:yes gene_type:complete